MLKAPQGDAKNKSNHTNNFGKLVSKSLQLLVLSHLLTSELGGYIP